MMSWICSASRHAHSIHPHHLHVCPHKILPKCMLKKEYFFFCEEASIKIQGRRHFAPCKMLLCLDTDSATGTDADKESEKVAEDTEIAQEIDRDSDRDRDRDREMRSKTQTQTLTQYTEPKT